MIQYGINSEGEHSTRTRKENRPKNPPTVQCTEYRTLSQEFLSNWRAMKNWPSPPFNLDGLCCSVRRVDAPLEDSICSRKWKPLSRISGHTLTQSEYSMKRF